MLTDQIKEAGVVGAGGAGFPTHVKLNTEAEYFIINAAECEPLIETDKFFCRMFTDELIEAAAAVGGHLKAKKIIIALKRKYEKEVAALEEAIQRKQTLIELFLMDSFYPAGDEQVLVQQITGRSVPERGIPIAVGAVVDNVGTVLNIYNAMKNIPLTEKYLSVTGAVERPVMFRVPLGTPILDCIMAANPKTETFDVILGGPMMGKLVCAQEDIKEKTVTKTTSNLLVLPKGHYLSERAARPMQYNLHMAQSACLQCRFCTQQCPRYKIGHNIEPHRIMRAIFLEQRIDSKEEYERMYGSAANCSECGICEMYACPMGLSPRKVNVYLKQQLREKQIDVPKNQNPEAREVKLSGKASTGRLIARLGLTDYSFQHADDTCITLNPDKVTLLTSQHIGKPAVPVRKAGDIVTRGELVAAAAENALSANIHASMDGIIEYADEQKIIICSSEQREV